MSNSANAFMARFVAFINSADANIGAELVSVDAQFFVPNQPEPLVGLAGYMQIIAMMRSGFPDIQWSLEDMVAEQDDANPANVRIAARFTMRGTHQNTFMGVPASGNPITVSAVNFYCLKSGKIVEEMGQPDLLSLMMQIGALPPMGA